jgi:hypothetical protein
MLLLLLALAPQALAPAPALQKHEPWWTGICGEFDRAVWGWQDEILVLRERGTPEEDWPEHPARAFWPRFEALAPREGRAVVWMLHELANVFEDAAEYEAKVAQLFGRVRAAGTADWVAEAIPALVWCEPDATQLGRFLDALQEEDRPVRLRVAAMLGRALMLDETRAEAARALRIRAASLLVRGEDFAPAPEARAAQLEELAAATLAEFERAETAWSESAYSEPVDGRRRGKASAHGDPDETFEPMLAALARAGSGRARGWLLTSGLGSSEEDRAERRALLALVAREGLPAAALRELEAHEILFLCRMLGTASVEPPLRALLEKAPEAERAQLAFGLADSLCQTAGEDAAQRERGLALLLEVARRWPDSEAARLAGAKHFRYTKLLVGMPIPDFEAVDVEGRAFKLSDHAGKVTVLDFWGFW